MIALHKLEDTYIIATHMVGNESLQDALILLYQRQDGNVSGLVLNKPQSVKVKDYLAHPGKLSEMPVWYGGPLSSDRLIAVSQTGEDLFITDRISSLTDEQLSDCLILSGQCVWKESLLQTQIEQGAWVVVANKGMVPNNTPAKARIQYVMDRAGWSLSRYVHPVEDYTVS